MNRSRFVVFGALLVLLSGCVGGGPIGEAGETATHDDDHSITVSETDREEIIDRERDVVRETLATCDYEESGIGGAGMLDTTLENSTATAAYVEVKIPYYTTERQEPDSAEGTRTPTPVEVHADATAKAVYRVEASGIERVTELRGPTC